MIISRYAILILISAPSLGVYYFLSLTLSVHLSVCLSQTCFFFFVSRWNRAIFWPSVLHHKNSISDLGPLTPKIYSPKFPFVGHWVSHSLWVIVCGSTTFGLSSRLPPCRIFVFLLYATRARLSRVRLRCGRRVGRCEPLIPQPSAEAYLDGTSCTSCVWCPYLTLNISETTGGRGLFTIGSL